MFRLSSAGAALLVVFALSSGSVSARGIERRAAAEARRRASIFVGPEALLQKVYASYIMVRRCDEARRNDLAVLVDAVELARADAEAKALSLRIRTVAPALQDGVAWQRAHDQIGPFSQNRENCRAALAIIDGLYRDFAE